MDTSKQAVNTFNEGLVMDLNPLTTPNNVLVNCLNGTIITNNGNEFILQNDMGNGRVETAFLPVGYVPVGTKEFGGIVYVASYNPLTNKGQIGSFPSPERNITSEEISNLNQKVTSNDFGNTKLTSMYVKKDLLDSDTLLRPGDKFMVMCDGLNNSLISNYQGNGRKIIKLHLAIIDTNNNIQYIEDSLESKDGYWMIPYDSTQITSTGVLELDDYRNVITEDYYTYKNKISGKLAIVAELESIDTFNSAYNISLNTNNKFNIKFDWTWDEEVIEKLKLSGIKFKLNQPIDSIGTTVYLDTINDTNNMSATLTDVEKTGIFSYEAIPYMSYGELSYLKKSGSINLSEVGSGNVELTEWRYYVDVNKSITINWGLNCYPKPNEEVSEVILNFYNINKLTDNPKVYTCKKRTNYNGNFTELITFIQGTLDESQAYLVKIQINQVKSDDILAEKTSTYFYRILYTTPVFNSYYLQDYDDFSSISMLGNVLITSNINRIGELNSSTVIEYPSEGLYSFNKTLTNGLTTITKKFQGNYNVGFDITLENEINYPFTFNETAIDLNFSLASGQIENKDVQYQSNKTFLTSFKDSLNPENYTVQTGLATDGKQYLTIDSVIDRNFSLSGSLIRKINSNFKASSYNSVIKAVAPYLSITNSSNRRTDLTNIFGQEGAIILPTSNTDSFHFSKAVGFIQTARGGNDDLNIGACIQTIQSDGTIQMTDEAQSQIEASGEFNDSSSNVYQMFITAAKKYFGTSVIIPSTGMPEGATGIEPRDMIRVYDKSTVNSIYPIREQVYLEDEGNKDHMYLIWKTTEVDSVDNPSYGCINYFGRRQTNYDTMSGQSYSYAHPIICCLNQIYLSKWVSFNKSLSEPDTICYTNDFETKYTINVNNIVGTKGNNLLSFIYNGITYNFSNVDSLKIPVFDNVLGVTLTNEEWISLKSNLPNYNNFSINLNSTNSSSFSDSIQLAETLEKYTTATTLDGTLLAINEYNGLITSTDSTDNEFDSTKLYWFNRSTEKFEVLNSEMYLYNDKFNNNGGDLTYSSTNNQNLFETALKKIDIGKFITTSNTITSDKTTRNELLLNHNSIYSNGNIGYVVGGMSKWESILNTPVLRARVKGQKIYSPYLVSKNAPIKIN